MILVHKPDAPARLAAGITRTQQDCTAFDNDRNYYLDGKSFDFEQQIYGHKDVKQCLKLAQHGKCCYCEGKFGAHDYGDIEHYRPKGAVKQDKNLDKLYPGYYWLAYCWKNLYYSCRICNHKKSVFFPLANPASRARSHNNDIADEEPLLLNPGGMDDLGNHVKFIGPRVQGVSEMGCKTIEIIDLNRTELFDARLTHFKLVETVMRIIKIFNSKYKIGNSDEVNDILINARRTLDDAVKQTAEYSAMTTDFVDESNSKATQDIAG